VNAELILNNVKETYFRFQAYSDVGTADRVPSIGKTPVEFKTYFVRPGRVRFEWRDWHPYFGKEHPADENAIWSNSHHTHMWFLNELKEKGALDLAIAAATGVSKASVHRILTLLLPGCVDLRSSWFDARGLRETENEEVNGFSCHHLVGTSESPDDMEVWVSKNDYVVRRIRNYDSTIALGALVRSIDTGETGSSPDLILHRTFPDSQYYNEYNYLEVAVNQTLPDHWFDFDPSRPPTMAGWTSG
jgi:hypothetical protein